MLNVSPNELKHFWDSYTGGAGKTVADTMALMVKGVRDPEGIEVDEIPIVRDWWKPGQAGKNVRSQYYQLMDEAKAVQGQVRTAKANFDHDEIHEITRRSNLLQVGNLLNSQSKRLKLLRARAIAIQTNSDLSAKERRIELDDIADAEQEIMGYGLARAKAVMGHD